jgi:glycosyltransferase involved in cell wall biosynthesis
VNAFDLRRQGKVALIVSDGKHGPTATQMISFGQPFSGSHDSPFHIVFERDYAEVAEVEAAFAAQTPDLLVLSRYTSALGSDWIRLARGAGIPVIFHIDDDLLAVPESLGASKFKAYNSPERLRALRNNIEGSDLVYVSTAELARRFQEHGIKAPIAAGDVYCAVARDAVGAVIGPATGPVIGYMGTGGHSADLAMIMPAVCNVMDSVPDLQFEVFGTIKMPAELTRFGSRVRHIAAVAEYSEFLPFLRSLGWWVGLAPLEDNPFNRCKADTKWVEYSLAGMAVVASDLPVYHRACADGAGVLAQTSSHWREAIFSLIHEPQRRKSMIDAAQNKLRETYNHDRLREQVVRVFEQAGTIVRKAS